MAKSRNNEDTAFDFKSYLEERKKLVEDTLDTLVSQDGGPASVLFEAMRYSLLAGGKRLRPIMALAACEAVGGRTRSALGFACALEMIHTYSMIHDDLPCMDDDDLRRGKPTNHRVYGEALAILAGDALLTDAFKVIAEWEETDVSVNVIVQVIRELANAAGSGGMVAGQTLDIQNEGRHISLDELELLHSKKTGALFVAAARGGGWLGGGKIAQIEALSAYARATGLAFQIIDDILDVSSSPELMGKRTQKDKIHGKVTYPALLGLERSRQLAVELKERAVEALADFGPRAQPLRELAAYVVERER